MFAPVIRLMENSLPVTEDEWLEECFDGTSNGSTAGIIQAVMTMREQSSVARTKVEEKRSTDVTPRAASKPHSTPLTLKWLEENYEIAEGVCIPRSTLYTHYIDYCDKNDTQPVNAASFGKIIRQQFPQITTRRLGTRGQSKYHYYGIAVKESSIYFDIIYSRKGVQSVNEGKKDPTKQVISYSPRSKLGTLLPDFPAVSDLSLPPNVTEEKVATFLMMYKTHCQRLLDTVIRANFDEVQGFLLHFWQGMPQHIVPILGTSFVVDLVGVCDAILYRTISSVLMPSVLQPLPDSLIHVMRKFTRQLDDWLKTALDDLPDSLRQMKTDMARRFGQLLKRQMSLNHLCQASRTVVQSPEITAQMLRDWSRVDLTGICKQTLYTTDKYRDREHDMIVTLCKEFEDLLRTQSSVQSYTKWLDLMIDRCVVQPTAVKPESMRKISRQFLLMWSCFGTRIIRDMTLQSAPSFGSFHLLHLMFDDYVLFLVESLQYQDRSNELIRSITGHPDPVSYDDDVILPKPPLFPSPASSSLLMTSPTPTGSASEHAHYVHQKRQSVITDAREAFASAAHSCGMTSQANTPAIRPIVSSPSQSSMTSFDGRPEVEARPGSGYVTDAPINLQLNNSHFAADGYERYGTSSRAHHSTDMSAYSYACVNSTPYTGYRSRDYGSVATATTDWIESSCQQRCAQRPMPAIGYDYQTAYYNAYSYTRPTDYETAAMYGYTTTGSSITGPGGMRTGASADSGATYAQTTTAADNISSATYLASDSTGSGKGRRKILDVVVTNEGESCLKRRYTNDYAGY